MRFLDDWLFPRRCPVCLDVVPDGEWICRSCVGKLKKIESPRCFRCGKQLIRTEDEYCSNCRESQRSFRQGIAGWNYSSEAVRRMIVRVKYHNERQLLDYPCREMAEMYAPMLRIWKPDVLIPVPLHSSRKRKRGFNQAEEIAVRLSDVWGIPVDSEVLFRIRKTTPQKELDEASRIRNLMDAFCAKKKKHSYRTAALVDDILTTGTTMEACTRILKKSGFSEVYSIALSAGQGSL